MKVISFDIQGKFAHFRKYYGNNTALTYTIPPRTTIIGMLASIMGDQKGSYYEKYSHENILIGVRVLTPVKKSFHRLNLLSIKSKDDFSGSGGRIQTPFEVVTPTNLVESSISYRIYVGLQQGSLFEQVTSTLFSGKYKYSLSLGPANFLASIARVSQYNVADILDIKGNWVEIHSACNSEQVEDLRVTKDAATELNHIEEELMPADFIANHNREVKAMNRVLYSISGSPFEVRLNGKMIHLESNDRKSEYIQFLEYAGILAQ